MAVVAVHGEQRPQKDGDEHQPQQGACARWDRTRGGPTERFEAPQTDQEYVLPTCGLLLLISSRRTLCMSREGRKSILLHQ